MTVSPSAAVFESPFTDITDDFPALSEYRQEDYSETNIARSPNGVGSPLANIKPMADVYS